MSRKKKVLPDWWLPTAQFRELEEWLGRVILGIVIHNGGEGIEASLLVASLDGQISAPDGWRRLDAERRRRAVWRSIDHLERRCRIERYHSKQPRHNRSRVRLREVGVLDRIVDALEKSV